MREPVTIPEIIDALGITPLAREFGHANVSTVSSWKYRGVIPIGYWQKLIAFAGRRGVTLTSDDLLKAHAAKSELPAAIASAPEPRGAET